MKAGWWDSLLMLRDLAGAIHMILGYLNNKNIYCKEYCLDWLVDSLFFEIVKKFDVKTAK